MTTARMIIVLGLGIGIQIVEKVVDLVAYELHAR